MDFKYTQNSFSDQSHALTAYAEKMVIKKKPRKLVEHPKLKCLPIPASNVIFNMNNDLAYAFSLCNICDKGEDPKNWLFYTLKNQVMYLDTEDDRRFEISKVRQKNEKIFGDYNLFRIAEVLDPWRLTSEAMANENRPLSLQNVKVLFEEAEWEIIQWGNSSIIIKDLVIENIISFKNYSSKIITVPDVIALD